MNKEIAKYLAIDARFGLMQIITILKDMGKKLNMHAILDKKLGKSIKEKLTKEDLLGMLKSGDISKIYEIIPPEVMQEAMQALEDSGENKINAAFSNTFFYFHNMLQVTSKDEYAVKMMNTDFLEEVMDKIADLELVCIKHKQIDKFARDFVEIHLYMHGMYHAIQVKEIMLNEPHKCTECDKYPVCSEELRKLKDKFGNKEVKKEVKEEIKKETKTSNYDLNKKIF